MKILVLNAGSSSQKSCLYDVSERKSSQTHQLPNAPLWEAQIDWLSQGSAAKLKVETHLGKQHTEIVDLSTRKETLSYVLSLLVKGSTQVIASLKEIDAVGHRVVHGGTHFSDLVKITPAVKTSIRQMSSLAPSHNPANLEGLELMESLLGEVPQMAVFDTAFHHHLPECAYLYPGPYAWKEKGIRRYGFHGISCGYCTQRAAQILGKPAETLRLIIAHLGNGASLTAVKNGRSIDTTMGFTPLDGLMMGTRSGAVDPGILIYLMRQGYSADDLDELLNQASGLKGISGVSHDFREIEAAIEQNNPRAELARDLYLHRLKACFGSMLMSLGGVDAIVFTGGVGEHAVGIRAAACQSMEFLGIKLDVEKNAQSPVDCDVATDESAARVLVIHTQEDWAIAQDCWRYLRLSNTNSKLQL